MYQKIGEKIWMAGLYKNGKFVPYKFKWQAKELKIDQVTLTSNVKDGAIKKRFYSVVCGKEVYRILFDRESEQWSLEEIWLE